MSSYPKHQRNKQVGFTLIEVLAALVILSIILLSFFSFFSQSALFTQKHRENLIAINLAQDTIVAIKKNAEHFQKSKTYIGSFPEPEKSIVNVNSSGIFEQRPTFKLELTITKEASYNLYKLHIQIFDLKGNQKAETYHYLRGSS
ncbi:type IV pilus modification PilV family protein [Calidifontibacillus oryziterrae]|uniref:type IV pilus modification PilV family protein n=1 Tax=Calidifontibacillus oryziterrae TaxID=1191699 RepID=UPI0002FEDFE5|nr:prepilin-type N-terminal cleavage/methylation domain-containing protein [Calidifontibacillus oryziterrae]